LDDLEQAASFFCGESTDLGACHLGSIYECSDVPHDVAPTLALSKAPIDRAVQMQNRSWRSPSLSTPLIHVHQVARPELG
jgi:hypothetical protein